MDVSIAVSLIRGQMGTVVERAVNAAVETVLAEMLKVVGVKFEELKTQVMLMKREIVALKREKALKEKENDNIRAKLRYTELKLKYYRQGVEEELQQRASASTLVRIHPPHFTRTQRGGSGMSPTDASPSCSAQTRTPEGALTRSSHECTSSQSTSRRAVRVLCPSEASSNSSDLLPASLMVNTPIESLDSSAVLLCSAERDPAQRKGLDQDECEWTATLQPHTEGADVGVDGAPAGQLAAVGLHSNGSTQPDSRTLQSSAPQVKQEEEEEEVICIKEEPEEQEQEVMATLLLDCQVQQDDLPDSESQRSMTEWSRLPAGQSSLTAAFSSAGPSTGSPLCSDSPPQLVDPLPPSTPPRQSVRPWNKDLSLYEEYKLRRNERRRRNINRRRELEKMLPQPLLADIVRERREKTRLRVARWRAKRKLQACLNQAQALGGAAVVSQASFPAVSQHQQLRAACAPTSSSQQTHSSATPQSFNNMTVTLPFIPFSSSSQHHRGATRPPHEHVTSSSSYPAASLAQQSISLTDSDILQ
ncbi:uncharacterized protein LOC114453849 [Parambassis ranga]|uniref:Uncharacterized protein LOC114453849 n=1 Tax=Parambassis ranga TaxID=210632 RepID=A0A6P7KMC0_9TELE|nr:uncharacterized protein LOC114453849 [Parambassis ranga]